MMQFVSESLAQRYFSLVLLIAFAAVALTLAVVGLYGVIAYDVAQRTREFGVRIALGATARNILQLVVRQGLALIALGIVLGLGAALIGAQLIDSMLFGVSPHDPATLVAITVLLGSVALLACLVPAHRATRVDPMTALRAE
jgi:ABC-type antimicrobial peptide transport system permease subunit